MKILVTGGAGFIGSHVVDLYLANGYEVVVVDDLSTGRLSNLNPSASFYQLDIRSSQLRDIFAKERPDFVNHHAAQMDVRRSVADPHYDADVNVLGSINLIECAKLFRVKRFIYISSGGAVYGEPEYLPCDEAHPINPICQYGASKHTVEHYLFMYHQNYGLEYITLRYPNVYGPRQDPNGEAGVVAIFTGQMLSGEQVTINGDGEQQRDYVYVADCAEANLLALKADNSTGIYNLGSGRGISVNEIFTKLQSITNYERAPVYGPAKLGETRYIFLDADKAKRELGWSPRWKLEHGLKLTVEYFRNSESVEPSPLFSRGQIVQQTLKVPIEEVIMSEVRYGNKDDGSVESHSLPVSQKHRYPLEAIETIGYRTAGGNLNRRSLHHILQLAMDAVKAVSGGIFLLGGEGQVSEALIAYNGKIDNEDPHKVSDTMHHGLAGWVAQRGQAALIPSTKDDPRWLRRSWENESNLSRSAISVPLYNGEEIMGVLTLVHTNEGFFFEDDLALLVTLAAIVSLSGRHTRQTLQLDQGLASKHG